MGLLMWVLVACGNSNAPATTGEVKTFANVCDKANDGKRVSLVGFLRFPDSFTGEQSVVLRMYETGDFKGKPVGVQTEFGTGVNQLEKVADQYTDEDLKVHLPNGQVAGFGTKVKVSGTVYFPLVGQEFDCALQNPLVAVSN
jgi:hypothetical protein